MNDKNLVTGALVFVMALTVGYAHAQREASPRCRLTRECSSKRWPSRG
jgi:hypothetical protein